jgi:hypothetical protein
MAEIKRQKPEALFQLFTTVAPSFFTGSGLFVERYEAVVTDIGLVQNSPLHEELDQTVTTVSRFLEMANIGDVVARLQSFSPDVVVSDISPLGIVAAKEAGIRSVLVENFTWDWIYEGYRHRHNGFDPLIEKLRTILDLADTRIQCEPVTDRATVGPASKLHLVPPIARMLQAGWSLPFPLTAGERYVLVSLGGIKSELPFLERLSGYPNTTFVIAGEQTKRIGNVVSFASGDERFYHPNLVAAATIVVSKAGYSTVAEVYHSGVPFIVVERPAFRESEPLIQFISDHNPTLPIAQGEFDSGAWLRLLEDPRLKTVSPSRLVAPIRENGAVRVARIILANTERSTDSWTEAS